MGIVNSWPILRFKRPDKRHFIFNSEVQKKLENKADAGVKRIRLVPASMAVGEYIRQERYHSW